ncbi:MAG: sigma 54-interacting transcriptional regulator [Eubacteriales bacterium]|nr:sigma 54-interacting transcriptional regulator [Eubacteriales bacterium]MDD4285866.1 sigma 54-interacting transcriptional regulator [Eubacteriales bacterium]NLV70222.1 sigma 54-interacting transcriptional regulator [Clostridiales bacterium]
MEQKQEELVNHLDRLFQIENFYDGILVTDQNGMIVYYKRKYRDTINAKKQDIIGRSVLEVFPVTEKSSTIMEVLRTGIPIVDCQEEIVLANGQRTPCIFSTIPVKSGSRTLGAIEVFNASCNNPFRDVIHIPVKGSDILRNIHTIDSIISQSFVMSRLKERIRIVGPSDLAVLIYGETGTGKDLVSQAIHAHSGRKHGKFISLNCAAIPGTLLESMLFGTVKGSYTGANDQLGLFEAANEGTLFLDEINKMDMASQSKILKAIEEQKIRRVGGIEEIPVNVRIIAALNQDPEVCVSNQTLRQDLYYRLNVLQLRIPPLRERKEDIETLTAHFIRQCNKERNKHILGISREARDFFLDYPWPGNVRELKNSIEGAFLMAEGPEIGVSDFDWIKNVDTALHWNRSVSWDKDSSLKTQVKEYERSIVQAAVNNSGTLQEAADRLGISKQSLNYKIKDLKIQRPAR